MLAERGERLDEAVSLVERALAIDPDNGSYLDSLGWALFKQKKVDQAEPLLRRAAEQAPNNSVVQDHFGDVLVGGRQAARGRRGLDRSRLAAIVTRSTRRPSRQRLRARGRRGVVRNAKCEVQVRTSHFALCTVHYSCPPVRPSP